MTYRLLFCFVVVLVFVTFGLTVVAHAQVQYSTQGQSSQFSAFSSQPMTSSRPGSGTGSLTQGIASGAQGLVEAGSQLTDTVSRTYRGPESQGVSGGDAQRTFLGPGAGGGARPGISPYNRLNLQGLRQPLAADIFPQAGRSRGLNIRPTFTLGFAYRPKVSPKIGSNVRACLRRIPNFGDTSSIRVSVKRNVVILEGTVARKSDRALASQLVALEPGVIKIDNRLKVTSTPSTAPATVH